MATIKQLSSALNKNELERFRLKDEIERLQTKKDLPKLKKKYEGKYFKYQNAFSSNDNWFIYVYCEEVLDIQEARAQWFELDPYGKWTFEIGQKTFFHLFQQEITQKEFDKAAIEFVAAAQTIMQLK